MNEEDFKKEFVELFAALIGQEIAIGSPVDTGRLRNSFLSTMQVINSKITWTLPDYWEHLEYIPSFKSGKPNKNFAYTRRILENKSDAIAEKVIKIMSTRI